MPAHRVPTAINEARGTYKKNPQRAKARENEPIVHDAIGDPPTCFMPGPNDFDTDERRDWRALWYELISDSAPGVLNRSHRWHLESACKLKRKERKSTIKLGESTLLNKMLTQMGMNPAAQSTVNGSGFAPAGGKTSLGRLAAQAHKRTG